MVARYQGCIGLEALTQEDRSTVRGRKTRRWRRKSRARAGAGKGCWQRQWLRDAAGWGDAAAARSSERHMGTWARAEE